MKGFPYIRLYFKSSLIFLPHPLFLPHPCSPITFLSFRLFGCFSRSPSKHQTSTLKMLPNEKQLHMMNKHGISPSQARQLNVLNRTQSLLNSGGSKINKQKIKDDSEDTNSGTMYYDPRHNTLHQWALRYTLGAKVNNDNIKVVTKKDPTNAPPIPLKRTKSVLRRAITSEPAIQIQQQPQYPTTTIDLLLQDDVIDEYKIVKCIGRGSFANVYEAELEAADESSNKVALKVILNHSYVLSAKNDDIDMNDSESSLAVPIDPQVQHELLIWRHLSHPNILPLIDVLHTNEAVFLVMELMHGSLLDFIKDIATKVNDHSNQLHRRSSVAGEVDRPKTTSNAWQIGSFSSNTDLLSTLVNNDIPTGRPATSTYSSNPQDWFASTPRTTESNKTESPRSSSLFPNQQSFLSPSSTPLPQQRGLPEHHVRILFHQLLSAIQYLHHSQSIVHNDLKLDNILITKYQRNTTGTYTIACKISDFGLSQFMDPEVESLVRILSDIQLMLTDPKTKQLYPVKQQTLIATKSYGSLSESPPTSATSPFRSKPQYFRQIPRDVELNLHAYLSTCSSYNESRATGSIEYCAPEELAKNMALIDDYVVGKLNIVDILDPPVSVVWQLYDKRIATPSGVMVEHHSSQNPFSTDIRSLISKYLTGIDIWGLGVILYCMMSGKLPFMDEFHPRLSKKIIMGEYTKLPVDEESMVDYELHKMNRSLGDQQQMVGSQIGGNTANTKVTDMRMKIMNKSSENTITVWADQVLQSCLTVAWFDRPGSKELLELPWCVDVVEDAEVEGQIGDNEMQLKLEDMLSVNRSRTGSMQSSGVAGGQRETPTTPSTSNSWKDFPNIPQQTGATTSSIEIQPQPQGRKKSIFDYPSFD